MTFIKKIADIYKYIYFRLYLFHKKEWRGDGRLGIINANFAITASAVALIFSIDFLFERFTNSDFFFDNIYKVIGVALFIIILQTIILREDEKSLEDRYSRTDENDFVWRLKGFFSLIFVFGPIVLLIFLMLTGIK